MVMSMRVRGRRRVMVKVKVKVRVKDEGRGVMVMVMVMAVEGVSYLCTTSVLPLYCCFLGFLVYKLPGGLMGRCVGGNG